MSRLAVRAHGATHAGCVREANEDCLLMAPELGLYGVLDGMGGALAGGIASHRARDAIVEYVRARRGVMAPEALLDAAVQSASAAVNGEARRRRDRRGMGTTVVLCLLVDDQRALVAHVGDSRAYLLRQGRLSQLTRDHTVVAELIASGAVSAEEALHHPYKSVLSRNLGAKPQARVDLTEVCLVPGDRLLLCSDGLTGFASPEAIEQLLGGADDPDQVSGELIEAALRGGGGDNVSVVVVEAGRPEVPRATQILRQDGGAAWWSRRPLFLQAAARLGLPLSPICSVLSADEALEIVAGNLYEAVLHDLQHDTGLNVWTYAENLTNGWLDQGGAFQVLRELLDILRGAAAEVLADVARSGDPLALQLEGAVTRALVVAEMAVGTMLAERTRVIEADLVRAHTARASAPAAQITEHPTLPYMHAVRVDPPAPEVAHWLEQAIALATQQLAVVGPRPGAAAALSAAHKVAIDAAGDASAALAARELYGVRALEEASVAPLLDALDQARLVHLHAVRQLGAPPPAKAATMRRLALAHRELYAHAAALVVDAGHPVSDALHEAVERTAVLRARVSRVEERLAEAERAMITQIDLEPVGRSG